MRGVAMMTAAAVALGGCATTRGGAAPGGVEAIRYATEACFGACPVYAVTVRSDGRGTFVGERFTAATGPHAFDVGAAGYRRLAATLARWRPAAGERRVEPGTPGCDNAPTDMPGRSVTWTDARGGERRLYFYDGCRREQAALAAALLAVPGQLPLADFIGRR